MVHKNPLVFVNYYAPWCYWSNKLAPDWYAPELTRARPGASVPNVRATRTSLPRTVRTGGAGRPAPRAPRTVRTGHAYPPRAYRTHRAPW